MQQVCFEAAFVERSVELSDKCTTTESQFVLRHSAAVLCLLLHFNGYVIDRISPFLSPAASMQLTNQTLFLYSYQLFFTSFQHCSTCPFWETLLINTSSFLIIDKGPILPLSALFALCKSHNNGDDTAKQQQDLFILVTISAVSQLVWATGSDIQFMSSLLDMQSFYSLSHE